MNLKKDEKMTREIDKNKLPACYVGNRHGYDRCENNKCDILSCGFKNYHQIK